MLSFQHFEKRVAEKELVLTIVKSPAHFVEIGWKMFCGDFMPRSNNATLEQRACRFDGVGINPAVGVLLLAVVDGHVLVFELTPHRAIISREIVSNDKLYIVAHVLMNDLIKRAGFRVSDPSKAQFPVPLADS